MRFFLKGARQYSILMYIAINIVPERLEQAFHLFAFLEYSIASLMWYCEHLDSREQLKRSFENIAIYRNED